MSPRQAGLPITVEQLDYVLENVGNHAATTAALHCGKSEISRIICFTWNIGAGEKVPLRLNVNADTTDILYRRRLPLHNGTLPDIRRTLQIITRYVSTSLGMLRALERCRT